MSRSNTAALPLNMVLKAMQGDEMAIAEVLKHYKNYIRCLATRTLKDEYGNEYLYVDEDMRLRLEAKLIYGIVKDFKILPA